MANNAGLTEKILKLKKSLKAVILVHNYQNPELYAVADFVGDSLDLAQNAQKTQAPIIIFCGVRFMAETAKILNPQARVFLVAKDAGCPLADTISAPALRQAKEQYQPDLVVAYVNTTAEVKAEAHLCVTSANAVKVISKLPEHYKILFVPDKHLAQYVKIKTGRKIIEWPGYCYVHAEYFQASHVYRARIQYPDAKIIVHPECTPEVVAAADFVASTSGMVKLAQLFPQVVLGTEAGMCTRIKFSLPHIGCYPLAAQAICQDMKKTTLERLAWVLESLPLDHEIIVPEEVRTRAEKTLTKMLEYS
ncbi:MAG: quinolinate synthase NadA [candidate division WOR-3 bacterium]